jgi:ABC-2 type transport system permease protein
MRAVWHIYRREVGTYFTTPMAYVMMTLFLVLMNIFFFNGVSVFVDNYRQIQMELQMGRLPPDFNFNATEIIMGRMFGSMSIVMLFLAPMVTMRLFAEENQLGTIETLLTCPVRDVEVILGKFLAAMTVFAVLLILTFAYPAFLSFQTSLEMGPIFTGYLGLLLLAAVFTSVGLFFSSMTENQIIAAALTFATLLVLWLTVAVVQSNMITSGLSAFLRETSLIVRQGSFSEGLIDLGDMVYHLTITAFGLFLTVNVLDAKVH